MADAERRTLLVEVGTEELPPTALKALGMAFAHEIVTRLKAASLGGDYSERRWFATPRRLAVLIPGLALRQPDVGQTKAGPSVDVAFDEDGKPTKAAQGFARSAGVPVEDLKRIKTDKGERIAAETTEKGRPSVELIPEIVDNALKRLPVPKRMRWGSGEFAFVRPVHWVVMLLGEELIETSLYGLRTGRASAGHRFHHPGPVNLARAEDYEDALEAARVIADFSRRRDRIREQVEALAGHLEGDARLDQELLDEVTGLTEWPVAIAAEFDEAFLSLPPEVITTTLVHHQKFFPVLGPDGGATTRFIAVANVESRSPGTVRQGYERVIRPRLADAAFFYAQDRKTPLAGRRDALRGMQFQKKLGSLHDKSTRIAQLARRIAVGVDADAEAAGRAAELAKCDLTTLMVGEFPELQGVMGGYYAAHDGEPDAVTRAIAEHYRPRYAGDRLPAEVTGQVVAVADKLDTVCGIFLAGLRPTGNKDPFALRRASVGVLRILVESALALDLDELIGTACEEVATQAGLSAGEEARREMRSFFLDRLRAWYRERGVRHDVVEAVLASGSTRPADIHRRIEAVGHFIGLPEAASLTTANKRIRNILRQAGGDGWDAEPWDAQDWDAGALTESEELKLNEAVLEKRRALKPLLEKSDYRGALSELAGLKEAVDTFFDHVMVMTDDEELKRNRLALLAGTNRMFSQIADISRLEVGNE